MRREGREEGRGREREPERREEKRERRGEGGGSECVSEGRGWERLRGREPWRVPRGKEERRLEGRMPGSQLSLPPSISSACFCLSPSLSLSDSVSPFVSISGF